MNAETTLIQTFISEKFGELRTVTIEGEIWFVAADVCAVLDIKNVSQALEDFDDDEKADISIPYTSSNGVVQNRNVLIVNEAGLYRLIFKSRKPEAKKFQRWVYHEVIPSIRKTGGYNINTSNYFNNEVSAHWEKIKSAEALIKIAKLVDSSNLQNQLLSEATILLTGKDFFKLNEEVFDFDS